MANESLNSTLIDFIPGMPPGQPIDADIQDKTNTVMKNSMPVAKIYPGIPTFTEGTSIYKRKPFFTGQEGNFLSYSQLLEKHGFSLSSTVHKQGLTVAYLADSFPTDSFTNEYGENFLQGLTDISSTAASSIAQMFGKRTAGEALTGVAEALKQSEMLKGTVERVQKGGSTVLDLVKSLPLVGGGTGTINALLAGSRLDFPMVWKSSGFQPSYTMTIRLYNPFPGDQEATKKYIAGPIAAIMLLGIPISTDGNTFSWPFIHRIWSPGIYDLDPAFISNITIIKGGDQQQIAYNQRLGIVDVRVDFGSLFSSMLATNTPNDRTRPTLKKYIDAISDSEAHKTGVEFFSTVGSSKTEIKNNRLKQNQALKKYDLSTSKLQAPSTVELTTDQINNPESRVPSTKAAISENLESRLPTDL